MRLFLTENLKLPQAEVESFLSAESESGLRKLLDQDGDGKVSVIEVNRTWVPADAPFLDILQSLVAKGRRPLHIMPDVHSGYFGYNRLQEEALDTLVTTATVSRDSSHVYYVCGIVGAGVSAFAVQLAHAISDEGVFPGGVVMVTLQDGEEPATALCAELSISHHSSDSPGVGLQHWCQRRAQPALLIVDVDSGPPMQVLASLLAWVPVDCMVSVLLSYTREDDAGLDASDVEIEACVATRTCSHGAVCRVIGGRGVGLWSVTRANVVAAGQVCCLARFSAVTRARVAT